MKILGNEAEIFGKGVVADNHIIVCKDGNNNTYVFSIDKQEAIVNDEGIIEDVDANIDLCLEYYSGNNQYEPLDVLEELVGQRKDVTLFISKVAGTTTDYVAVLNMDKSNEAQDHEACVEYFNELFQRFYSGLKYKHTILF